MARRVPAARRSRASSSPASCTGPCPSRSAGGQSRLEPGVVDLHAAAADAAPPRSARVRRRRRSPSPAEDDLAQEAARRRGVEPDPEARARARIRARMGLVAARPLHPLDPDQHPDDHQLVAGLLLLLGTVDVRAAVRPRPLPRQPGRRPSWCWHCSSAGALVGTLVSGRVTDVMLAPRRAGGPRLGARRCVTSAPPRC